MIRRRYNLVFHKSYADATIGWRTGTRKFVVVISDAQPHGPVYSDGFTDLLDTEPRIPTGSTRRPSLRR